MSFQNRSTRMQVQFLPCFRQELPLQERASGVGRVEFLRNSGNTGGDCKHEVLECLLDAVPDGAQEIRREHQDPASYFILYVARFWRCL